ncbi:MAG: hypothetical protein RLZZ69_598 [Cyanobacteriota bacterium]
MLFNPGKTWRTNAKNQIYLLKFVLYAIALSPGVKNGRNAGMMLNTVAIAVVVANSRLTVNHKLTLLTPKNISYITFIFITLCLLIKYSPN